MLRLLHQPMVTCTFKMKTFKILSINECPCNEVSIHRGNVWHPVVAHWAKLNRSDFSLGQTQTQHKPESRNPVRLCAEWKRGVGWHHRSPVETLTSLHHHQFSFLHYFVGQLPVTVIKIPGTHNLQENKFVSIQFQRFQPMLVHLEGRKFWQRKVSYLMATRKDRENKRPRKNINSWKTGPQWPISSSEALPPNR